MKKLPEIASTSHRNPLFASLATFALVVAIPAWLPVYAQVPARAPVTVSAAVQHHIDGIALENRGDEKGAFTAFLEAAEDGYPPAQRRLGEIYDSGNSAVERDYEESIRWYQKAREGGEQIPPPKPRNYAVPPMLPRNLTR